MLISSRFRFEVNHGIEFRKIFTLSIESWWFEQKYSQFSFSRKLTIFYTSIRNLLILTNKHPLIWCGTALYWTMLNGLIIPYKYHPTPHSYSMYCIYYWNNLHILLWWFPFNIRCLQHFSVYTNIKLHDWIQICTP